MLKTAAALIKAVRIRRPSLFLLLWLVVVQGCGEFDASRTADLGRLRYGTGTPLQTFDPHRSDLGPAFTTYLVLVYDGLTRADPVNPGEVLPGLAHRWEWLDDLTVEFHLRRGVRFIDGEPFDAYAAEANIRRMLSLEGPRIRTVASIERVQPVDEHTLRISLKFPDPTLTFNLGLTPGMMISPAAFDNPDLDLNPVGTGPWIYEADNSTIGEVHRFRANPDYFDGRAGDRDDYEIRVLLNSRARLNALVSGQIDFAMLAPPEARYAGHRGFALSTLRMSNWMGMTIIDRNGELVPELADVRVRRALGYAVDRQALADAVYFGFAEPRSQPMSTLGRVRELEGYYYYDPDKARGLLKEAGVSGFDFTVPVRPVDIAFFEAIQHYLGQVGIDMEIKVIEQGMIPAVARSREFPVNTIGYPTFDPDSRHAAIWAAGAAFNPFRLDVEELESLAAEARTTRDEQVRERLFDEYFRIVVTNVYSLVYLHLASVVAYDADRVAEVELSLYGDPPLREMRLGRDGEGG